MAGVHPRCLQELIPTAVLGIVHALAEEALALPCQQGEPVQKTPSETQGSQIGPLHMKARAVTPCYILFLAINYHGELLAPNSVLGLIHYPDEQGTS